MDQTRLRRALDAIDARNAEDPNYPKELMHSRMVTGWIHRLRPDASEPLLLAARAHHVRRWAIPRNEYPDGRTGYLTWRRTLQDLHAAELCAILESFGYAAAEIARAEHILRKRELARDPDSQALEDALCLVFLETQFHELAARLPEEKMIDVVQKTLRKMSPAAIQLALTVPMAEEDAKLLRRAAGI